MKQKREKRHGELDGVIVLFDDQIVAKDANY